MKTIRFASAIALALALFVGLSAMTVVAEGQAGTSPANAPYIDNQTHRIPGNSSIWYRFDYHHSVTGD